MREIKFRAWDNKINDWAICSLFLDTTELDPRKQGRDKGLILMSQHDDIIIEQFTGLHDKNGKGIYEGDILRSGGETKIQVMNGNKEVKDPHWQMKKVVFHQGCFMSSIFAHENSYFGDLPSPPRVIFNPETYLEVVGNIHENPDLLTRITA